jgi:hypothetical protein
VGILLVRKAREVTIRTLPAGAGSTPSQEQ